MTASRPPIPDGEVSTIVGRWQAPALTWLMRVVLVASLAAAVVPGAIGIALATLAVSGVIAAPLVRVAWLVFRWTQEGDRRFVVRGVGLLVIVAVGALLAALGIGS
jgi:hypothetical protein